MYKLYHILHRNKYQSKGYMLIFRSLLFADVYLGVTATFPVSVRVASTPSHDVFDEAIEGLSLMQPDILGFSISSTHDPVAREFRIACLEDGDGGHCSPRTSIV